MGLEINCSTFKLGAFQKHIQSVIGPGEVTYEIEANRMGLNGPEKGLGATTD